MPLSPIQSHSGSPYAPAQHSAASAPAFVVSREDVLSKYTALLAEAENFQRAINDVDNQARMVPMGGDPVSGDVAGGINDRLWDDADSYVNICRAWVDNLFQTAEAMAGVAQQYGFTDEEIAAAFSRGIPSA